MGFYEFPMKSFEHSYNPNESTNCIEGSFVSKSVIQYLIFKNNIKQAYGSMLDYLVTTKGVIN